MFSESCLALWSPCFVFLVCGLLVLLFVAVWFLLRGDLFYVLHCVILFLCFSVLSALRLPRLGKRELILVLFVRLFDLLLFGFVCFIFLLVSGKDCGLWLWHSLDFSLTFFFVYCLSWFVCSSSWCLWCSVKCDCGNSWMFFYTIFLIKICENSPRNATITKNSLPEAPQEGKVRNK